MKQLLKKIVVWILTLEARLVLYKYKPRVVAVTGSVGKTSTKDAIYTVLSATTYVRKSQKSFNSELGVPLTILGCDTAWSNPLLWLKNMLTGLAVLIFPNHYPKWLVLEVGLDRPGDIHRLVQWLCIDIAVLTRLPEVPVHVEFFESPQALREEKRSLVKGLKKHGVLLVNYDDERLQDLKHPYGGRRLTYGLSEGADIQATHIDTLYEGETPCGLNFKVEHQGSIVPVNIRGVLGHQHIYPALVGIAVGIAQDINLVTIGQALERHEPAPGRMRILEGVSDSLLIDDSYNASPIALEAALETLTKLTTPGRIIAVLGDMTELGNHTADVHKEIGRKAGSLCDLLITVGPRARYFAEGARDAGMPEEHILERSDSGEVGEELRSQLHKGDLILIKGSQSMRMERVTKALLKNPHTAPQVLVRQDSMWLQKV
jgi:UDP-N-acetylmuramoyl-tripeptide--D-alanyl-D-alanine ligase